MYVLESNASVLKSQCALSAWFFSDKSVYMFCHKSDYEVIVSSGPC